MRRTSPVSVPGLLIGLAFLSGCGGTAPAETPAALTASAAPTVAAPPPAIAAPSDARHRVEAAMDRFLSAQRYHAVMTTTGPQGDVAMDMDFVAPDRYRLRTPTGTQHVIGDTVYMTMNGRTLRMPLPKGQIGQYRDPARLAEHRSTLSVESLGNEIVDGRPAGKYRLRNAQPAAESLLWIGERGYPLKLEVESRDGERVSRTVVRYSRFDDPSIRIDPP